MLHCCLRVLKIWFFICQNLIPFGEVVAISSQSWLRNELMSTAAWSSCQPLYPHILFQVKCVDLHKNLLVLFSYIRRILVFSPNSWAMPRASSSSAHNFPSTPTRQVHISGSWTPHPSPQSSCGSRGPGTAAGTCLLPSPWTLLCFPQIGRHLLGYPCYFQ